MFLSFLLFLLVDHNQHESEEEPEEKYVPVLLKIQNGFPILVRIENQECNEDNISNLRQVFNPENQDQIWCYENVATKVLIFPNEEAIGILYDTYPHPVNPHACALIRENENFERFIVN